MRRGIGRLAFILALATTAPSMATANGAYLPSGGGISAPQGARSLCQTYRWACATSKVAKDIPAHQFNVINKVNLQINGSIRVVADRAQYNSPEHWALPTPRGGDCEDFALLKKRELIRRGLSPQRLLLATALDRRRNSHAVLIVRTDAGDYVLDNQTNKIKRWSDTRYIFLRIQDPDQPSKWQTVSHG